MRNLGYEKIIAQINEKFSKLRVNNIHISFDLDVMDPSVVDAVSVPESNGLTTSEYCELTDELHLLRGVVCAMDIVEYNVALDKYNFTYSWLADNIPYIIALLNENERGKNYSG